MHSGEPTGDGTTRVNHSSQELRHARRYARIETRRKRGAAMGRSQAVRHGTLDPAFGGSNPPAPAIYELEALGVRQGCSPAVSFTGLVFSGLMLLLAAYVPHVSAAGRNRGLRPIPTRPRR
jgi:hypothetical protein